MSYPQQFTPITPLNYEFQQKIQSNRSRDNILSLASFSKSASQQTLTEIEQAITNNFQKIHRILDQFDGELNNRLQIYEKQVLAVVKQEIWQMNNQTRKLVNDFQDKIKQKQGNELIWHFRNQSDFFKHEALKLFQINKQLRGQIKNLKKSLSEYQNKSEIKDLLLQKLKKKQLKQRQKFSRKISNTKVSNSHFTELVQAGTRQIRILKTRQRLQVQASKRLKTQQSNRVNFIEQVTNTQNEAYLVRHKTQGEKDKLLGTHFHQNTSPNNYELKSSQPQLKITKLQTENSRRNISKSYLSQFFQRMDKSTQTQQLSPTFLNQEKPQNKQSNTPHRQNSLLTKQINFQKNGFIVNYPSQTKKQKSLRKSSDYSLFKYSRDIVHMNETFIKNKLNQKSNDAKKSSQRNSLFAKHKRQ